MPNVFSLRQKTEDSIVFINQLKDIIDNGSRERICINFKNVSSITSGAISMLLSVVNTKVKDKKDKKKISITLPKDIDAQRTLLLSGLVDFLDNRKDFNLHNQPNKIISEGDDVVSSEQSSVIVKKAMETLTGEKQRNKKLQILFIELMANSVNHGFIGREDKKKWYISTSHNEDKVSFTFIDNGDGILRTLNDSFNLKTKLIDYVFYNEADVLQDAFEGNRGSRTGLDYRGRGLPFVLNNFLENHINNLFILTNNVILDYKNNDHRIIPTPYSGTFYYFEITKNNISWMLK